MKNIIVYITAILVISSCNNYYKAITISKPVNSGSIDSLKKENKYFILRDGTQAFAMNQILITTDQKAIECNLDSLPDEHRLHLTNGKKGKMIYGKIGADKNEKAILNEVHIFAAIDETIGTGQNSIAIDKLQKVEVLKKDKQKTTNSYLGGVGILIASLGTALLILYGLAVAFY